MRQLRKVQHIVIALSSHQRQSVHYLWPALLSGGIAWLLFLFIGQTPLIRATGLALVIVGVALTLRRLGAAFAITGGLALALSPAFWSQTGGGESTGIAAIVLALGIATTVAIIGAWLWHRPYLGLGLAIVVFAVIFWSQIGTPRSLRLTSFLTAWLMYLLINTLRQANPRPEDPPAVPPDWRHKLGLLLLLAVGIINDPLFTLFLPAVYIGLLLSNLRLTWWYTLLVVGLAVFGFYSISQQYVSGVWWNVSAENAERMRLQIPFLIADGWREGIRWVGLFGLVIQQFTIFGVLLGILGLARLARWYPVLGIATMTAYAAYSLFGLLYFGTDRAILLLPMLIIQVFWMTYAVYAFGQWIQKSLPAPRTMVGWLAPAAFTLLPLLMLLRILNTGR